jgi:hypothetical protein
MPTVLSLSCAPVGISLMPFFCKRALLPLGDQPGMMH